MSELPHFRLAFEILWPPTVKIMLETVNEWNGWMGEKAIANALSRALDNSVYRLINNVIVPTSFGSGTTQIDHAIVSRYGVFVIETKTYTGRVYANPEAPEWFQVRRGFRRSFPNALWQNHGHVKALVELLGCPETVFESVVFFAGGCVLETTMPANVLSSGLVSFILARRTLQLRDQQVAEATRRLREYMANGFRSHEHARNLQARWNSAERCPRCPLFRRSS
jgi:hypothetical protein